MTYWSFQPNVLDSTDNPEGSTIFFSFRQIEDQDLLSFPLAENALLQWWLPRTNRLIYMHGLLHVSIYMQNTHISV